MLVSEAVEASGRALGVSAHVLEVEPVADVHGLASEPLLRDAVNAVTGRAPDRVFDRLGTVASVDTFLSGCVARVCKRRGAVVEAIRATTSGQDLRDRVLVVEHDAAEVAVNTVVEVQHVALGVEGLVLHCAACDHVASNRESRRSVVAAWFSNNADGLREVGVNGR